MIHSMTGYGRAEGMYDQTRITVELRSVNNRYLDCNIRTSRLYAFLEDRVKAKVNARCARGKIEVGITIDASLSDHVEVAVNESAVAGYLEAAEGIARRYGLENDLKLSHLLGINDIFTAKRQEIDNDALAARVGEITDEALTALVAMRRTEGERLADDIDARCQSVLSLAGQIEARGPDILLAYRLKIEARLRELLDDAMFDPARVVAEAAVYADRIDVTEELVRLRSHIAQLGGMLKKGGAVGRKLDFLVQELNREANTIGSKVNDAALSSLVVELKSEIERIREQAQNIE